MQIYDYLIVGSGLFGATVAHELTSIGKSCIVIDKRSHVGGNVYTELMKDIVVHKYGAHILSKKSIHRSFNWVMNLIIR